MCFGWRYLPSISSVCYHLSAALCHFSVDNLPRDLITCSCKNNRLRPFLDILTIKEHQPDPATAHAHVFTTDLGLINNKFIRCNLPCGLNHVIPQPSMFQEALQEILTAWTTFCNCSTLVNHDTTSNGMHSLPDLCHKLWLYGLTNNMHGHHRHQIGTLPRQQHWNSTISPNTNFFGGLTKQLTMLASSVSNTFGFKLYTGFKVLIFNMSHRLPTR